MFRKGLHVFVLDCDYGLGIVTRGSLDTVLAFTEEELDRLTYSDLERNREKLINLKSTDFLFEFMDHMC